MQNTITALVNGALPSKIFLPLQQFVPIILILIPISVGWVLMKKLFEALENGYPIGLGEPMSSEYRRGVKTGYWKTPDEYLNG